MKRDDQTGLAFGGNKTRKLEFLVGEAIAQGCDTLITGGADQSNHCRQTAAAAAACGLSCHLVLGGRPPGVPNGNLLLNELFGANIHWTGELRKGEKIPEIAEQIRTSGYKPYVVPYGGSNAIGAAGYVEGMGELGKQLSVINKKMTHIVFPTSSGGTHAGLVLGKAIFNQQAKIVGIGIDKGEVGEVQLEQHVLNLANSTAERLKVNVELKRQDIIIRNEYLGDGYGVMGELERRAIRLTAQNEGILLDPVYTGRAMGALIEMVKQKAFSPDDKVLFWHTGGTPALFPYATELMTT
jgi:D-cysteine desulfhydrase